MNIESLAIQEDDPLKNEALRLQNHIIKSEIFKIISELIPTSSSFGDINELSNYIADGNLGSGKNEQMENLSKKILSSNNSYSRKFKYLYKNRNKALSSTLDEINKISKTVETEINNYKYPWLKNWARNKLLSEKNFGNTFECLSKYELLQKDKRPAFLPFYLAYFCYKNKKTKNHYLTIVDFEKPKNANRFYMINMKTSRIEYCIPCAQGRGYSKKTHQYGVDSTYVSNNNRHFTGVPRVSQPNEFSNKQNSYLSSLGCSYTPAPRHSISSVGDSLLVHGYEKGFNDATANRGIYVHGGLNQNATNEPSEGCIVIQRTYLKGVLEKMQGGGLIFSYYPQEKYLTNPNTMANLT